MTDFLGHATVPSMPSGLPPASLAPPLAAGPVKKPRRWGASCLECRRRKKGCEGRDPDGNSLCTYCPQFGLPCIFAKQSEPNRIKQLEDQVARMRDFVSSLAESTPDETQAALDRWMSNPDEIIEKPTRKKRKKEADLTPSPPLTTFSPSPLLMPPLPPTSQPPRTEAEVADRMRSLLDAAGFDLARRALGRPQEHLMPNGDIRPRSSQAHRAAVGPMDVWPNEATPQFESPVSHEACREMLDLFFCWWNPRWNIIDRQLFEESMQRGDNAYCTPFLLVSIFSVVAKHSFHSHDRVDEFGARGHYLLGLELYSAKPRITTVQGLLCLAAFTSDKTRHAQSYNFVGFAIRMLDDLSFEDASTISPEEVLVRRICSWFCFGCDKMVSLTMSRPPRAPRRLLPPLPEIDPAKDAVPWLPVRHHSDHQPERTQSDVAQPSLQSSCNRYWCEAQIFFDEVLHQIYAEGTEDPAQSRGFVLDMRARIEDWLQKVPPQIYLRFDVFPDVCPPAHIIYLNLALRVISLLLVKPFMHRPDVGIPLVEEECARLAAEVHALFRLYTTAFPPALSTLNVLHVFAGFSACHIDLLRLRDDRTSPAERPFLLERIALTTHLLSEGAGLRSGMSQWVAKLIAQRDEVVQEHRGRYDPIRDQRQDTHGHVMVPHHTPHASVPSFEMPGHGPPMQHGEGIDFSSLSAGLFSDGMSWPQLQQDEEVSRVLKELQQFSEVNTHYSDGVAAQQ